MLLYSLVHVVEIFQYTGLIFQLLVEAPRYFQPPVVFWSYQTPNNLKSTILEAVSYTNQTSVCQMLRNVKKRPLSSYNLLFKQFTIKNDSSIKGKNKAGCKAVWMKSNFTCFHANGRFVFGFNHHNALKSTSCLNRHTHSFTIHTALYVVSKWSTCHVTCCDFYVCLKARSNDNIILRYSICTTHNWGIIF